VVKWSEFLTTDPEARVFSCFFSIITEVPTAIVEMHRLKYFNEVKSN
jgi:hypothetical protein